MNFLNPAALGALALLIPVLAFYLMRQQARTRSVSTLLFWSGIKPQVHSRPFWRRFRHWLSFLLQALFISLLAVSLANPLPQGAALAPARVVFVLDASPSMQATTPDGATVFATAKDELRTRIRNLSANDRAAIVISGESPTILQPWTDNAGLLLEAVEAATPDGSMAPVGPALALARSIAELHEGSAVALISDGVFPEDTFDGPAPVVIPAAESAPNAGITRFSGRRLPRLAGEFILRAEIVASGPGPFAGRVSLYRDNRLIDAREVTISPREPWTNTWQEQLTRRGSFRLEIEPGDAGGDSLAVDNTAEIQLTPLDVVSVKLPARANPFLEAVFLALPATNMVASATPNTLVVAERTGMPESLTQPTVIINPTGSGWWGTITGELDQPVVADWAREAPLLEFAGIETVEVRKARQIEPPRGATVYVSSPEGPLVYGDWERDTTTPYLVVAFDLDDTDFELRTAFPVMMGNALQILRGDAALAVATTIGRLESSLNPPEPDPGESPAGESTAATDDASAPATADNATAATPENAAQESEAAYTEDRLARKGFAGIPLWWIAALVGFAWCFIEWTLWTRRITE